MDHHHSVPINYILCILVSLLIIYLFAAACTQLHQKEINNLISQTRQKYAPDSRVALFDIHVNRNCQLAVEGETNLTNAFHELDSILRTDYPEVEFRVSLLPSEYLGDNTRGIITVSVANLRPAPNHSAELITQALLGTPVKVLKKEENWYLIQTPDLYLGWTNESSIRLFTEDEIRQYSSAKKLIFTDMAGSCYTSPAANAQTMSDLVCGCMLTVTAENAGFRQVKFPDERTGYVKKNQSLLLEEWEESCTNDPEKISETAIKYLGLPYLWGGTSSKGVDCSGFTKMVYFMIGIILQRDASQQVLYGELIRNSAGYQYLEPADLLFFGTPETDSTSERVTHTGIYIGEGEIIHASGMVKINSLVPGRENYSSHLDSTFIRARRILTRVGEHGIESVFESEFYQ